MRSWVEVVSVLLVLATAVLAIPEVQHLDVEEELQEGAGAMLGRFQDFMKMHGKSYDSDEEFQKRLKIFGDSVSFVEEWNSNPNSKFRVAVNEFADMSDEEFAKSYLSKDLEQNSEASLLDGGVESLLQEGSKRYDVGEDMALRNGAMHVPSMGGKMPKHVNWAQQGRTGSVYKQGVCAACYTFTTNAAIEGQYFITTGKRMPELSDQEILSCSRPFGNHGCIGGNMEKSYHYILDAQENKGGMTLAQDYPYEGSENPCKRSKFKKNNIRLEGYRKVQRGNEQDLMDAVAQFPVAVGYDAHHPAFKLYDSGVFDIDYCTTHLTHAMLIVGYGTDSGGKDYWKVQNSWGKNWGEEGYGKIARGKNMCAIANLASYPVLDKPEEWSFAALEEERK